MSLRLVINSLFLTIIQLVYIIPYGYCQGSLQDIEFNLFQKEVLVGYISFEKKLYTDGDVPGWTLVDTGTEKYIVRGEVVDVLSGVKTLTDPSDMDFTLDWWKNSSIYGIKDSDSNKWQEYLIKLIKIPQKPDLTELPNVFEARIDVLADLEDDIPMGSRRIDIEIPNLISTPPTHDIAIPIRLSKLSIRRSDWKVPWKFALVPVVALGGAYLLDKLPKETEKFSEGWREPTCWTACALGEPDWAKPPIPSDNLTPEEWRQKKAQNPELQMWYPTPFIIKEKSKWHTLSSDGRDVLLRFGVGSGSVFTIATVWKYIF